MKEYGLTHEQLAYVAVAQRQWAAKNPRAMFRDIITVEDVLASRMVAYPFHLLECCLVTDGGGALVVTSADRAADFPKPPVHVLGTGEASETPMISQMLDFTESQMFRQAGQRAFAEAGITTADVDHLMIYDAFAHVPIYGLEALGFVKKGEAGPFIADGNTEPGGSLPLNTNGGGLSYTHTGDVRHVRHPGGRPPDPRRGGRPGRRPRRSAWWSATAACSPPAACWSSARTRGPTGPVVLMGVQEIHSQLIRNECGLPLPPARLLEGPGG